MNKKAFTLIELLIVIMILGILAALISGNFFTSLKKGRDARRKADLEQVQRALEMYYEDKRAYPTAGAGSGFVFGSEFSDSGKLYMKKVPNDPISGKNYEYDYDEANDGYKLYTCLENTQQILPFSSALSPGGGLSCAANCFAENGTTSITCIWGISSPNTNP